MSLSTVMSRLRSSTGITEGGGSIVKMSAEVSEALERKKPVVALESAMVSGGLAYPDNFNAVKKLEGVIRENGAVPAMIAILDGVACIGLSDDELTSLAFTDARNTDRKDIAHVIMKKQRAGTTVSAAVFLANLVGIPIVVTSGITNIPSDLTEMGRTSTTVVCAGAESVADTPKMLEYLESHGIYAASFYNKEFPAFESIKTSCQPPNRLDSLHECAQLIEAHDKLMSRTGILIAVPIATNLHRAQKNLALEKAKEKARYLNVTDAEKEKFVERQAKRITSLRLVNNFARLGAQIAVVLSQLQNAGT